jgi:16S rRNA A1518/A1519 N6-dimethyltransferase RsmA/KsgA/DIM1 with predicted DNA glycosylase/AP lyase activity
MRAVFSKRRKQISSIAKSAGADSEILNKWLEQSPDLPPDRRPEAIENKFWVKLNELVKQ